MGITTGIGKEAAHMGMANRVRQSWWWRTTRVRPNVHLATIPFSKQCCPMGKKVANPAAAEPFWTCLLLWSSNRGLRRGGTPEGCAVLLPTPAFRTSAACNTTSAWRGSRTRVPGHQLKPKEVVVRTVRVEIQMCQWRRATAHCEVHLPIGGVFGLILRQGGLPQERGERTKKCA